MTSQELEDQFEWAKAELDFHLMLGILAALEAHFRRDFKFRCKNRLKDDLSREFRKLKRKRKDRVRLDEDILDAWKNHHPVHNRLVSDIRSALNLRHWLAHGRHWLPKLGRNYDFTDVEILTYSVLSNFDFR